MTFERIGKQILAHGFHYADAADDTAAQFILEAIQAKASAPLPAEEMLGVLRAEIDRQCSIGAGSFHIEHETGLWELAADIDPNGLRRALARTLIAKVEAGEGAASSADESNKLWEWFSAQHNLELSFYSPVYGDDDDQSREWRVHRVEGSINDREWILIGTGATARDAVQSAVVETVLATPSAQESGE